MSLAESFNVISLSVLNTFLIYMDYDMTKHSSYELRKGNTVVPLAYGADIGDFYLGSSVVYDSDHAKVPFNPIFGLGFGLGNSETFVGLDSSISIGSVNPFGVEGVAHDSHYGFKLHRQFFLNNSISIGAEDFISTGRDKNFYGSYYLNSTQLVPISNTLLILTTGIGTGRFYTSNYYRKSNGEQPNKNITPLGIFGSVIYCLTSDIGGQISSSADLIGSLIFFNPLFFTNIEGFIGGLGLIDLSQKLNKENLIMSISYTKRL